MDKRRLMLGNEAIAQGLAEYGCQIATSYPGTPASEILSSVAKLKNKNDLSMHVQWAINEKVAFEIAYAGSMSGLKSAVSMKQVGLNVASDPLMSAAYMGCKGGFLVISADDPGPHSSQTEQDSRMMAMIAKIPVLDPDSPEQARQMIDYGFKLSERFEIPVMIRPVTRVCHTRQDIEPGMICTNPKTPDFEKNPARWAATPKFRFQLHKELEKKLEAISQFPDTEPICRNPETKSKTAVVASGVSGAHCLEIMKESGLFNSISLFTVVQPYPLHQSFITNILSDYEKILVIEETMPVIEMQLADRNKVMGKMTGHTPRVGELLPENVEQIIFEFAGKKYEAESFKPVPGRRPTLCAGCPHRASFFAIKKAARKGIYTSDIGCYTLGLNLKAVDTVLCMGAAISQAAGFYHSYKDEKKRPDIVATMGDSTFFHAGVAALIDAVVQDVRFVLVILDNRTTAMTGNQPTPDSGFGACGEKLNKVDISSLVKGCGVKFVEEGDPYDTRAFTSLMKKAVKYSKETGPAVVISKRPCLLDPAQKKLVQDLPEYEVGDECDGCAYCIDNFECPALILHEEKGGQPSDQADGETDKKASEKKVSIDPVMCSRCGVCVDVCPKKSIREKNQV
ncbi:thiamine pyrophosphate-dependent enzyme [Desulfobacterales bacterium HSG16]|nr:thiamine pyrophosphate-dependent enzyme [Desulfobacterales bacterium HSG16]